VKWKEICFFSPLSTFSIYTLFYWFWSKREEKTSRAKQVFAIANRNCSAFYLAKRNIEDNKRQRDDRDEELRASLLCGNVTFAKLSLQSLIIAVKSKQTITLFQKKNFQNWTINGKNDNFFVRDEKKISRKDNCLQFASSSSPHLKTTETEFSSIFLDSSIKFTISVFCCKPDKPLQW